MALKRRLFLDFETAYFLAHLSLPRAPGGATLASSSAGFVGFRRIPLGFGVAFAPSDILVVGMSFQAALEPEPFTAPGGSARSLRLGLRGGLAPFVEVLFLRRRDVRPFVQVRGGFSVEQAFLRAPGQRAFAMEQALEVAPTIGVSWGAHAFVSEDISVDASITLDHRWNFRRGAWRPEEIPATDEAPVDVELRGWRIGDTTLTAALVVGFSRWF